MTKDRLNTFVRNVRVPLVSYFFMEKLMAFPTTKRNVGNTRSVGVKPNHLAWSSGQNVGSPPGSLTIIMKHTVMPRNTSRASKRVEVLIMNWRVSVYTEGE